MHPKMQQISLSVFLTFLLAKDNIILNGAGYWMQLLWAPSKQYAESA